MAISWVTVTSRHKGLGTTAALRFNLACLLQTILLGHAVPNTDNSGCIISCGAGPLG